MDKCYLEKASIEQKELYFTWVNDSATRKFSIHNQPVSYEEHCKWFDEKLHDKNVLMLICKYGAICIGRIRVDFLTAEEGEISFSIAKEYRGKGFGYKILELLEDYLQKEYEGQNISLCLIAKVKSDNIPSQKCFEKMGYVKEIENEYFIYRKMIALIGRSS